MTLKPACNKVISLLFNINLVKPDTTKMKKRLIFNLLFGYDMALQLIVYNIFR